jgi:putative MATE family efflux protein
MNETDNPAPGRFQLSSEPLEWTETPPDNPAPAPLPAPAEMAGFVTDPTLPAWRKVISLAWPVLTQQLLILTVAFSDQFIAGRFKPADKSQHMAYQAAQTTAIYLGWLFNSYTILVAVGSTALVARFIGAGERANAIHVTNQSILLAVLFGLIGSGIGLTVLPGLIEVLELRGPAAEFAADYLRPLFLLLVFQVIETAGIACLAGAGDTHTGLFVLGGVALVNLPLAWGLYLGLGPLPALGFTGIALGTAISHLLGGLVVLTILAIGRAGLRLEPRLLWPHRDLLRRLLRISVPAAIDSLSGVLCQLWFLSVVNRLGVAASGAHGIALRLEGLAYLSGGAFGTAAMTLVGQNLGARRPDQAAHSGWVAFRLGCWIMCFMGAVFFALAPQMFTLFCPYPEQAPEVAEGVPVLRLVAFAMPALACTIIFTASLRGAGDTRVPVLFTWIGFLGVRIPLAYFLALDVIDLGPLGTWSGCHMGLFGAWLAMFADLLVRGAFFLIRFASGRWQTIRV